MSERVRTKEQAANAFDEIYLSFTRERARAAEWHGYTCEYDLRMNPGGQLLLAAMCYYSAARGFPGYISGVPRSWPFSGSAWKPDTPHANLVKAGAFCIAEMERREVAGQPLAPVQRMLDIIAKATDDLMRA